MSANEWVATAESADAGTIQARFRQAGRFVDGTIAGTAIHIPALSPGPAYGARAIFGGPASLTGIGFVAGEFGATAGGFDGVGSGSFTVGDAIENTCTGTTFS